jgi:hypothetical protein
MEETRWALNSLFSKLLFKPPVLLAGPPKTQKIPLILDSWWFGIYIPLTKEQFSPLFN